MTCSISQLLGSNLTNSGPDQVLKLESTNVKALYRRAQAYTQLVDLELAESDFKKALEVDPDNR